jgi:hypothetical protein
MANVEAQRGIWQSLKKTRELARCATGSFPCVHVLNVKPFSKGTPGIKINYYVAMNDYGPSIRGNYLEPANELAFGEDTQGLRSVEGYVIEAIEPRSAPWVLNEGKQWI